LSDDTNRVVGLTKRAARAEGSGRILVRHALMGALLDGPARDLLKNNWNQGEDIVAPTAWAGSMEAALALPDSADKIQMGPGFREVFKNLYTTHGGTPPLMPLLRDLLLLADPGVAEFVSSNPGLTVDEKLVAPDRPHSRLGRLVEDVAALHNQLSRKVIGQAAAIQQIADAMFAARMYHRDSDDTPAATLLFLGPPGVGKTYTGQLIAESILAKDPGAFLRLDMSGYADPNSFRTLVGFEPSFQGARPGVMTEHVAGHPESVILVDEVEKAFPTVHNLFLQVLDRGVLEDKFHKKNVSFGKTTIVFTTNLGKDLYMSPNQSGALALHQVSRPAVMEALRASEDPMTGQPSLSPEFCSRLAKGHPIMFGHLSPLHLEQIASLAIEELNEEFTRQLGIRIPMPRKRLISLLVLCLGPDLDARTLSAGVPLLIKDGFRDVLTERRDELVGDADAFERIHTLELRLPEGQAAEYFDEIYKGGDRVIAIADKGVAELGLESFPEFRWVATKSGKEAVDALRRDRADFVLLDLDLHLIEELGEAAGAMRAMRRVRAAYPDLPVYLYCDRDPARRPDPHFIERTVAAGGARGFIGGPIAGWAVGESGPLTKVREEILRERHLRELFRTRKTVSFDWESEIRFEDKEGAIILRPKDVHEVTVVASKDRTARLTFTGIPSERFDQVAGTDEAKRRLREVIGWMRNPEAIRALGVDLPTGILLEGPPGNGKTMMARATAGEAGLPFFAASATDFSSKWVGESEKNVRELFERAASYAPSILFIDEIDAIGARRSQDATGVSDQILTQLLVSMDGFSKRERPIFFLAATNRADLLDPALKRPGRFDYIITIDDLDVTARAELFRIKTRDVPIAADVDLDALARASWGLSGAKLTQVTKEAAILAFRESEPGAEAGEIKVTNDHFREALTNVRYGLRKDGPSPSGEDLKMTAYHEAGHALIAELERPGSVHQATILPRGRALGFVESLPEDSRSLTAAELRSRIRVALAGRAAEALVFGKDQVSAGCSQDLAVATRVAGMAVTQFGMSDKVGPISLAELERMMPGGKASERAGEEVERMVREQEKAVDDALARYREALDYLARILIENETVDGERIAYVGKQIREKLGGQ